MSKCKVESELIEPCEKKMASSQTQKNLKWGILYFLASSVVSIGNNIITKSLGQNLSVWQVSTLRLGFGTLLLLPIILYKQLPFSSQKPSKSNFMLHIVRGFVFFFAIYTFNKGVYKSSTAAASLVVFIIPIFVLIFSSIFLKEPVGVKLWIATLVAFVGALVSLYPISINWDDPAFLLLTSALLYSILDIIHAKYIRHTPILSMLCYSSLVSFLLFVIPASYYWQSMSKMEYLLSCLLGIGHNLILYYFLKALSFTQVSRLQPLHYCELILASIGGYVCFGEIPQFQMLLGGLLILSSMLYTIFGFDDKNG